MGLKAKEIGITIWNPVSTRILNVLQRDVSVFVIRVKQILRGDGLKEQLTKISAWNAEYPSRLL
jgi:hypothetical protein